MDKITASPIATTGAAGFLEWLKRYQPYFYQDIKNKIPAGMAGFGLVGEGAPAPNVASTTTATPSWLATVGNLITAAGQAWMTKQQLDAQKDILNMQLDRAQHGLAPLDIDPQTMGLPGAQVSVGLSSSTQKMLMYGAMGLAVLLFLPKLLKR